MGDIKIFKFNGKSVEELESHSAVIEKTLQELIEKHLDVFLGIRFLSTEHSTGKTHGGRIDTLGIDENDCPVIIEYKRATNENVINQGLFYLDWLMDHKAEFELLVRDKYGKEAAKSIEWSSPRLICIAGNFTKYDVHAVQQINRNIELIRYSHYGKDLLLLDLVNSTSAQPSDIGDKKPGKGKCRTVTDRLSKADKELSNRYEMLKAFLLALGDDIQLKPMKNYFAFKRIKNFACVEVHPQSKKLLVYVKVNPDSIDMKSNKSFLRDVRKIGHFGTGDLELAIKSSDDIERAKPLLLKSYEAS